MGGGNSKEQQLQRLGQLFSEQERQCLNTTFHAIAGYEEATFFSNEEWQKYISKINLSIPKEITLGIFSALTGQEPRLVQFGDFVESTSSILKGSYSQKAVFMCKVCSQNTDTSTLRLQNLKVILLWFMKVLLTSECAKTIFPQSSNFKVSAESSQCMIDYLMSTMREDASVDISPGEQVSPDKLEEWMVSTPLAVQILETIFAFVFYYRIIIKGTAMPSDIMTYFGIELNPETGKVIPDRLIFPLKSQHPLFRESFDSKLLDQSLLMFLNSYFPHSLRGRFFPLFSSSHHGESFSTFCKSLVGCSGPTLLVIRDKKGHVFGGFASTVWRNDPNFIGDPNCFLFQLAPKIGVYLSTGYNQHYMYLEQNAQTLPKGLGMGGQLEYFGLWLSADYGRGHSRAKPKCTTYGSPMLSATEEFEVDMLELWGVGDPVLPEEKEGDNRSILDKDKMATHILEMAGKKIHSEGLRDPEEKD